LANAGGGAILIGFKTTKRPGSAVNGRQYVAVYTGDGMLTGSVVAYNKELKSARRVNTIQVFALPEDVATQTPLLPAASATKKGAENDSEPGKPKSVPRHPIAPIRE
jgi:hypothetical protein